MKDYIIDTICKHCEVTRDELRMANRKSKYIKARHLAFYFIRKYTDLSLSDTGRLFYRDHATVMNGERSVAAQIKLYSRYRKEIEPIEQDIINALPVNIPEPEDVFMEPDYFTN